MGTTPRLVLAGFATWVVCLACAAEGFWTGVTVVGALYVALVFAVVRRAFAPVRRG
jgi:hypothetical protein